MIISTSEHPTKALTRIAEPRPKRERMFGYIALFIAIGLIACEWYLYRRCFLRNIAPYFPGGWDQVGIYCGIYQLHFSFSDGQWPTLLSSWLTNKVAMKGIVVELLGAVFT